MGKGVTRERIGLLLQELFRVLLEHPDGLPAWYALENVAGRIQLTEHEAGKYETGRRRFDIILMFATIDAVKAGWMTKSRGFWAITGAGRAALKTHQNPDDFYREASRLYREWRHSNTVEVEPREPAAERLEFVMAAEPLHTVFNAAKPKAVGDTFKLLRVADEVFVPVHYATNREPTGEADPNKFYGAKRSRKLHFGRLVVSIPKRHIIGRVERPTVWRLWRESPEKHIVLRTVHGLNEGDFFQSLAAEVARLDERNAFVFIHGFNVSFASAAHRAAQMAYDLFLVGDEQEETMLSVAPILFSWPSKGNPFPYTHDANSADASVAFLKQFLKDVAQRSGATSLTVIAHSMGNRLLTAALKEIGLAMQSSDGPIVREVILAAPDIDRDVFEQAAAAVMRTGGRVTLYASNRDKALKASILKNGYPRAGDASGGGVLTINGMDSIDASLVGEDLLAHSYVGQTDVLKDLHAIITHGDSPKKRFGLAVVGTPPNQFWRIRARA